MKPAPIEWIKRHLYVASSWRNDHYPVVIELLKGMHHLDVYDFRNPPQDSGFAWSQLSDGQAGPRVDGKWQEWTSSQFRDALKHPVAKAGFESDRTHLENADATLLVQPCGRSAHLELGVAIGKGQKTAVYWPEGVKTEPELRAL